jgi:hypothetical protein
MPDRILRWLFAHGLGATHDMMLAQYEQHFAAAGIATLAFDYRHTSDSDGQPRQRISMSAQRGDVLATLSYLTTRTNVDPDPPRCGEPASPR